LVRVRVAPHAWPEGFAPPRSDCLARGIPFLAFGGEAVPDAELTALSTVPSGIVTQPFGYLVNGGRKTFEHLLRFVGATVLFEGYGFDAPEEIAAHGVWRAPVARDARRPLVAVVFYRA